jgi:F0F1-type ATP synthase assembly protein I
METHKFTNRIWWTTPLAPSLLSGSQASKQTKVSSLATQHPDSITKGAEIAGTVLVFFLLGWFIDRQFTSTPWFMITFVVLAVVAQFVKLYYVYNAQMTDLEAKRREAVHSR